MCSSAGVGGCRLMWWGRRLRCCRRRRFIRGVRDTRGWMAGGCAMVGWLCGEILGIGFTLLADSSTLTSMGFIKLAHVIYLDLNGLVSTRCTGEIVKLEAR